jgi:RimJ/RimL family protein N-acetyltransferase
MLILRKLKKKTIRGALSKKINIYIQKKKAGYLLPIGPWILKKTVFINKLRAWREKNKIFFFFQKKKFLYNDIYNYLNNYSIKEDSRIFFLICDKNSKCIGNIGISNFTNLSCELDNMIKGEKTENKFLTQAAEETIIIWAFNKLKCSKIKGVLWDFNSIMLNIHKSFGFKVYKKVFYRNKLKKKFMKKIFISLLKKNFKPKFTKDLLTQ